MMGEIRGNGRKKRKEVIRKGKDRLKNKKRRKRRKREKRGNTYRSRRKINLGKYRQQES